MQNIIERGQAPVPYPYAHEGAHSLRALELVLAWARCSGSRASRICLPSQIELNALSFLVLLVAPPFLGQRRAVAPGLHNKMSSLPKSLPATNVFHLPNDLELSQQSAHLHPELSSVVINTPPFINFGIHSFLASKHHRSSQHYHCLRSPRHLQPPSIQHASETTQAPRPLTSSCQPS